MIYIDMRNWFATFWIAYSDSFKGLSTEQDDDEKSNNCVCGQVFHRKYKRILWPFILAVSLEMFDRTTQKDTEKLKSFL